MILSLKSSLKRTTPLNQFDHLCIFSGNGSSCCLMRCWIRCTVCLSMLARTTTVFRSTLPLTSTLITSSTSSSLGDLLPWYVHHLLVVTNKFQSLLLKLNVCAWLIWSVIAISCHIIMPYYIITLCNTLITLCGSCNILCHCLLLQFNHNNRWLELKSNHWIKFQKRNIPHRCALQNNMFDFLL